MITFDNANEIDAALQAVAEGMDKQIIYILKTAGEKAVRQIRAKSEGINGRDWTDQTGNLRSSVGFGVIAHGKLETAGGFYLSKSGQEGIAGGRKYLDELVKRYKNGYTLIVVAGMEYATYVSDRGYDVLDSGEAIAQQMIDMLIKSL